MFDPNQFISPAGGGYPSGGGPMGTGGPNSGAVPRQPGLADMGGRPGTGVPPFYRAPFYPTAPFYSTNPDVGYQTRFYSGGILNGAANTQQQVAIQFDLPVRLVAINGKAFTTNATAITVGYAPNDQWLFQLQYSNGDLLHTAPRIASTVVGSAERPGEIGGAGWSIDQGASVVLNITPLIANLRIDVTLVCLEMRGRSNYGR